MFNYSSEIIGALSLRFSEQKMSDFVHDMLSKHEGEVAITEGSLKESYAALYHQIKVLMIMLDLIDKEINNIIAVD